MNLKNTLTALMAATLAGTAGAGTATLVTDRDATLIQPQVAGGAEVASGSGDGFFVGRVGAVAGGTLRRGAIHFDLTSIPRGSTITSVSLSLTVVMGQGDPQPAVLYLATADWGEGASVGLGGSGAPAQAGDATWTNRFFPDVAWSVEGGDFSPVVTAVALAPAVGPCVFSSSAGLVADVQAWVDDAESNFGWIILGNEGILQTARRYASRESKDARTRPTLTIEFTPPPILGDLNGDGVVDGNDLAILLGGWGVCAGCVADINGDGVVDGNDLAILLGAWS